MADATPRTFDVAALIERRPFDRFNMRLVAISWLITVFDGFDLSIAAFTAPYMRDELGLTTAQLANVFSAGLLGMTLGGLLFSPLSDRIGRRPVVIGTAFGFGILTMATAFAPSYHALLVLRLLDGFAIGGMVPIAWALNVEFVPKRLRATVVTVIMVGYSVGTSGAGPMTVMLEPLIGWRGMFLVGGIGSIVAASLLLLWLPESVRLLVSKNMKPEQTARLVNRLDPAADARATDRFILGDEQTATRKTAFRELFVGRLAIITPLLWLGFTFSSIAIYFVNGWGPIVLEAMQYDRRTAALATAFGGIMGSAAGLAIMRVTDRRGPVTVLFYPTLLLPLLLVVGLVPLAPQTVLILAMAVLMLIGGMHFAFLSIIGTLYPTAVRGAGSGWASSVGKLGGVFGPLLGGVILSSGMPAIRSYLVLAICPAVVLLTAAWITRVVSRTAADSSGNGPSTDGLAPAGG
ncbi:MAG: transporter [Sphingomonas bacterium]|nr:MFS transporter [Sphingomonas bacterium]MDB5690765.1 transporter [Sphingomonas bacterium]